MAVHASCRVIAIMLLMGIMAAGLARAQGAPQVKQQVAPKTPVGSGEEMFKAYCIACRGPAGKGDGPAAAAMKTEPADLSAFSKKNGRRAAGPWLERHADLGRCLSDDGRRGDGSAAHRQPLVVLADAVK